jgi:RIO-like serine/threonine protein kinase
MTLIAGGATADVFLDDNNRLVKLFKKNFSEGAIRREASNQKIIYEMGIPVPKIFDVMETDGRYAIVMEYIKGKSLGEKFLKSSDYVNGITIENNILEKSKDIMHCLSIIIDMQIKTNSIMLGKFPLMKDKLIRQINKAELLGKNSKDKILKKLDEIKFKNNLCHGDFHPFNLIETDSGIKIIDWADATIGNADADIYRSFMIYELNNLEIAKKYLEMYCNKASKKQEEIIFYEPVIMAARLSENITEKEKGEIINRIKKYV